MIIRRRGAAALATAVGLCVAFARADQGSSASAPAGKRIFAINIRYPVDRIPKSLQQLDFWFPMPLETEVQQVQNKSIRTPYQVEMATDPDTGNQINYMKGAPRGGMGMQVHVSFDIERSQQTTADLGVPDPELTRAQKDEAEKAEAPIKARWLRADTLVVLDEAAKSAAAKATAGKKKPVDKARAIYDYVTTGFTLLESAGALNGAGLGDLKFTLAQKKGDAADIATVFVGLCRAAGIPARSVVGYLIPTLVRQGELKSLHHWAEFYVQGRGWIPVDPALGMHNPSKRAWYFGAVDENRVALSIGRDITLIPPQHDRPLNFWAILYWEGDQKAMPIQEPLVSFEELSELKNRLDQQPPPGQLP